MPDTKITALTALTAADPANDVLPIVDVSDTTMAASGTTKKISINNVLGASGTATLASATITGDLTVDTSTLKVDSANNRVGVGTASPAAGAALSVLGTTSVSASDYTASSTWASRFQAAANNQPSGIFLSGLTSGGAVVPGSLHVEPVAASSRSALIATYAADSAVGYFAINRFSPSAGTTSQHFKIDDTGVATWSNVGGVAGTAMTLNSTGLGVGVSPSARFHSKAGAVTQGGIIETSGANALLSFADAGTSSYTRVQIGSSGNNLAAFINSVQSMTLDASGNLGIGVTPKPWRSGARALQLGANGYLTLNEQANGNANICFAAYEGSANVFNYTTTGDLPSRYVLVSGTHQWYTAPSGTAGNAISFTQAMTLDASGNLLVGTTGLNGSWNTKLTLSNDSGTTKWAVGPYLGGVTNFLISAGASAGVYLNGTAATSWTSASDERLKDIIEPISNAIAKVGSLRAVIGKFKFDENNTRKPFLIAQDIQAVLPEAVDASNPDKLGVAYTDVIPLLVAAIKELTAEVNALKNA